MKHSQHSGVLQRFYEFIEQHNLNGQHIAVAFSGGPDSTALLVCAKEATRSGRLGRVLAIHVDHGVRDDSARDADRAQELAAEIGVDFASSRLELSSAASEVAMRNARYEALYGIAHSGSIANLMTAHHRRDQAETVLLHLIRGSGLTGLAGIDPVSSTVYTGNPISLYRPLLDESPDDIASLISNRGIAPVVDSTNMQTDKTRNFLRHEVLPRLASANPGAEKHLANLADLVRADDDYLDTAADIASREVVHDGCLESRTLANLPLALQRRVIRSWVAENTSVELSFERCEAIRTAALAGTGGVVIELGSGWTAHQRDRRFTLHLIESPNEEQHG